MRALLANINRNDKARPDPFRTEEFLLFVEPEPATPDNSEPALINGLTPADWRLALYLQAFIEQTGDQPSPPPDRNEPWQAHSAN